MKIIQHLKSTALKLRLWDSDFEDRLKLDLKSHKKAVVKSVANEEVETIERKCRHFSKMPVKFLPNCASYEGINNKLSWLDAMFGITKRSSKQGGSIIGWRNSGRNNYIRYRMNQMGHLRDRGWTHEYWRQAESLMKNVPFRVMCMNFIVENWQLESSDKWVSKILKELDEIISKKSVKIDYKRVYIPKANGKIRPLGVPSVSWRIYLHMRNVQIVWFRMNEEYEQHAYFPEKGVFTAWKKLFPSLTKEGNIYEFDLRQFFDSVSIEYNYEKLIEIGVPQEIAKHFSDLNKSIVKLCPKDEIDETAHREVIYNSDGSINPNISVEMTEKKKQELIQKGYKLYREKGVPQGASTSCGLSTLNLAELYKKFVGRIIMYADDGLVFPNSALAKPEVSIPEAGVQMEESKSTWVKKEGSYVRALKFLGLQFIPANVLPLEGDDKASYPRLRSATRNGSKLEYDEKLQFLSHLTMSYDHWKGIAEKKLKYSTLKLIGISEEEINQKISKLPKMRKTIGDWITSEYEKFNQRDKMKNLELMFKSSNGPSILSRLYNGSLDLLEVSDNSLKYSGKSWVKNHFGQYLHSISTETWENLINVKLSYYLRETYTEEETKIIEKRTNQLEELRDFLHSEESKTLLSTEAFNSLFKFKAETENQEIKESLNKHYSTESETREEFHRLRLNWKRIIRELKLSLANSSTLACDSLLLYMEKNQSIQRWKEKDQVKFCKVQKQVFMDKEALETLFTKSKSQKRRKLHRKHQREIRNLSLNSLGD